MLPENNVKSKVYGGETSMITESHMRSDSNCCSWGKPCSSIEEGWKNYTIHSSVASVDFSWMRLFNSDGLTWCTNQYFFSFGIACYINPGIVACEPWLLFTLVCEISFSLFNMD